MRRFTSMLCGLLCLWLVACDGTVQNRRSSDLQPHVLAAGYEPETKQAWNVYYGNLHSHSEVSDGVESPSVAFAWARDKGKLDFLCLSEHNHKASQSGMNDVSAAATSATNAMFVGLVGQEYSTLPPNGGNHINVYDVATRIPSDMNNNYRRLYKTWLPQYEKNNPSAIVVGQFNHAEKFDHDYGIARRGGFANYDGNWTEFVSDADRWISLITIITGPSDSNKKKTWVPPKDIHRDTNSGMIRKWKKYLDKGFHLSPVADQDNHRKSWGTRTTARTAVWVSYCQMLLMKLVRSASS